MCWPRSACCRRNPRPCWCRSKASLGKGVTAKDIVLAVIGKIGTAGGTGYAIEFAGSAIRALSMEGRMTVCNMAIEAGARAGMVAVDDTTIDYLKGRPFAPQGRAVGQGGGLLAHAASAMRVRSSTRWSKLDAAQIKPQVTWGTSPEMVVAVDGARARSGDSETDPVKRDGMERALAIHGLAGRTRRSPRSRSTRCSSAPAPIRASRICARRRQWRSGKHSRGQRQAGDGGAGFRPGQAAGRAEGLDKIFIAAGFEWREPGCSMCLAMNADRLEPGERCASTSNRNFEGRQGAGRAHPSGQSGDGCGCGDCRAFCRCA